jgi:hypothetical protein
VCRARMADARTALIHIIVDVAGERGAAPSHLPLAHLPSGFSSLSWREFYHRLIQVWNKKSNEQLVMNHTCLGYSRRSA